MLTHLLIAFLAATVINLFVFLLAYRYQSDKLTDITYSLTFVVLCSYCLFYSPSIHMVQWAIYILVLIWAVRLGGYLLYRIYKMGRDKRFDQIRIDFWRFFRFFIIQGVGAWIIALPAMVALLSDQEAGAVSPVLLIGLAIAIIGLIIEVVSDAQKSKFKSKEGNSEILYTGGLYSIVRYPNYTGEILFWIGIFVAAIPFLKGFEWLVVLGPITIILLLVFVSGIPYLEKGRKEKYGSSEVYQEYKQSTAKLIPGIF